MQAQRIPKVLIAPDISARLAKLCCTPDEARAFHCFAHQLDTMNEVGIITKNLACALGVSGMQARKIMARLQQMRVLTATEKRNVFVVSPHLAWGGVLSTWPKARASAHELVSVPQV